MRTGIWVVIVLAILVFVGVFAVVEMRNRRTKALQQRFGAEYERAVQAHEQRRSAEADLRSREKQRSRIDVTPLSEQARARFAAEWHQVQERFVDQPVNAVTAADDLVYRVMDARGYPMHDFDTQADLVSVDHPQVVENYRAGHRIYRLSQVQKATTEDLREALLRYRSLFDELLQPPADRAPVKESRYSTTTMDGARHRRPGRSDPHPSA